MEEQKTDANSLKKRGNFVLRQELKTLTPKCDANCAIALNCALMILFLAFGIPIIITASQIKETTVEYTTCVSNQDLECTISFILNETFPNPVYFYYEIHNFYMNHRDFVKSRNFAQLRGEVHVDSSDNSKCEGAKYIKEIFDNDTSRYFTFEKKPLQGDDYANPCGLIAKSFFNDSDYRIFDASANEIKINETGISNDYDRDYMFKRIANYSTTQWLDVENEHFIVWMQMESFQNFRKLWGWISVDLNAGKYTLKLKNRYNATSFNGQKFFVLSTTSPLGTGNFFGFTLLGGAMYCLVVMVIIYIFKVKTAGKVYTVDDLKWS